MFCKTTFWGETEWEVRSWGLGTSCVHFLTTFSDMFLVIFISLPLLPIYHCSPSKFSITEANFLSLACFSHFWGFETICVHFVTTFSDMFKSFSSFCLSFQCIIALLHYSHIQVRTVKIRSCIDLLIGLDLSGVNPTKVRNQKTGPWQLCTLKSLSLSITSSK